MIQRRINHRPTYNYTNEEPITANYYPVTSRILIKNIQNNIQFALINDRAQGGTSLRSGEIEIMV